MSNTSILSIVDHIKTFGNFGQQVKKTKFDFSVAEGLADAFTLLQEKDFQVALFCLPSLDECKELQNFLIEEGKSIPIIVLAQEPSVQDAISYLQAGAKDYVTPPFDGSKIISIITKTLNNPTPHNPPSLKHAATAVGECGFAGIIGQSERMRKVFSLIEKVCDADTTVLIHGESGTGKELIARALHFEGERRNGPFIPVNCGAIPAELLESELFGHEKGAFTHAIRTRMGRFELADSGTVFLDEISEMSPMLQVKILRVLQEKQFERIGGTKTIKSDFRVIAATNRDLEEEVEKGHFRQDLYYRLNVIPIEAPPLRERASDIPLLLAAFVERFIQVRGKGAMQIDPDAHECLMKYGWPGNVRELENVVERMVILASGDTLTLEDIPGRLREGGNRTVIEVNEIPEHGIELNAVLADFEKRLIFQALDKTAWVKNRAAKLLHINRTTLLEKMKRYKIVAPEPS